MQRITLVGGLLLGLTIVIWLVGAWLLHESRLDGRTKLRESSAQLAAAHVEDVLTRTMAREEHLARMVSRAWSGGEGEARAILDLYPKLLFESNLHLVRPRGEIVWSMDAEGVSSAPLASESAVLATTTTSEASMSECISPRSVGLACVASPVVGSNGQLSAVLLAQIDLEGEAVDLLSLEGLNDAFAITLAGEGGVVLASNGRASSSSAVATASGDPKKGVSVVPVDRVPGWSVSLSARDASSPPLLSASAGRLLAAGLATWALASAVAWVMLRRRPRPPALVQAAPFNAPRALTQRLVDDRRRLSHDLGDGPVQSLAALAMVLSDLPPTVSREEMDLIARARSVAHDLLDDLRRLANRLYPPTLRDFGLEAALKSYLNERFAGTSTVVHVASATGTPVRRDELVDSVLFSATQELVDGIRMHADAGAVLITIRAGSNGLDLTIEHDGNVSGPVVARSETAQSSDFDIDYLRQLVSAIGGTVEIHSQQGLSTRVRISVPE